MKFLIVGLVNNPQLKRFQEEGKRRGHQVDGCYSADLLIKAGPERFEVGPEGKEIHNYDLIYLWAFAKRRWEWVLAGYLLQKRYQIKIVNQRMIDPGFFYPLTPAVDYLFQTENKVRYPKSIILFSSSQVEEIKNDFQLPLILKVSASKQGKGVHKINSFEELKETIGRLKSQSSAFIVREFLPNDGDIRVFTVGFKAIGAMKRTPKLGEFRSNISQGGSGSNFDLQKAPEVREIAERLSRLTRIEIAGVDIMINREDNQPYVLEINPGPQFLGLERYTPTNAALEIIKYFESLVKVDSQC